MDVTPQELRGSEIKEAFRGFNRDEVDDLLERAAVTIEGLTRQVHELEARLATAPAAAAVERPLPSSRDDADMLQRTLVLAQRAADETVAEAQAQARQLVEESEARAHALVSEAEATARRLAENERRRLEDEINDLSRRRDVLAANADALEQYVSGYRDRVRSAIEADLDSISRDRIDAPSPRPELQDVELPPASRDRVDRAEPSEEPVAAARATESVRRDTEWPPPANAAATGGAYAASAAAGSSLRVEDPPLSSSSWLSDVDFSTSAPEVAAAPAPWERATAEHQPFAADAPIEAAAPVDTPAPVEAPLSAAEPDDDLDDDAFFASLREAVRDDAPLGPRDEPDAFFEEPREERRSPFRRRR
jgi:cell division septum initiation protein DivIVA